MSEDIHDGGCLCGALRYHAVIGEPTTVTHCYCRMCRKGNGGTFVTWIGFPAKGFAFTRGQPNFFRSSDVAERAFCGNCGCQLTFQAVGDPRGVSKKIWVALGSTDRPGDIKPTDHIFTDKQLPWLRLNDHLPRWPSQVPWIRPEDALPRPTVPQARVEAQRSGASGNDDTHEGSCLCGSIRYRGVAENRACVHCHCAMCRKSTGATLVSWVHFNASRLVFTEGRPRRFVSSQIAERTFCGTCGCQFTFRFIGDSQEQANSVWVTLGSTDRPEDFEPTHEIFTDDQLPWLCLRKGPKRWSGQLPWLPSDASP